MIFKRPKEGKPDFIKGHIAIKVEDFSKFMQQYKKSDGWLNIDLLMSKENKLYLKLDTWQPKKEAGAELNPDNVPF